MGWLPGKVVQPEPIQFSEQEVDWGLLRVHGERLEQQQSDLFVEMEVQRKNQPALRQPEQGHTAEPEHKRKWLPASPRGPDPAAGHPKGPDVDMLGQEPR